MLWYLQWPIKVADRDIGIVVYKHLADCGKILSTNQPEPPQC